MEKEFIPYEQAKQLKELGFKEECLAYFINEYLQTTAYNTLKQIDIDKLNKDGKKEDNAFIAAPLFQQAFRWFREKYKLQHEISPNNSCTISYLDINEDIEYFEKVYVSCKHYHIDDEEGYEIEFPTYEEAELACLITLIEIVQNEYPRHNN